MIRLKASHDWTTALHWVVWVAQFFQIRDGDGNGSGNADADVLADVKMIRCVSTPLSRLGPVHPALTDPLGELAHRQRRSSPAEN